MSVLFNHGLRHELLDRNPVQWVRQSAKWKKIPAVLEIEEVQLLLGALDVRERTMVLLDVVTGLRASELFGLKWTDTDFIKNDIRVTRSIVLQVVGPCKTEASQKPVPLDPLLATTLRTWRVHMKWSTPHGSEQPTNKSKKGPEQAYHTVSLSCRQRPRHMIHVFDSWADRHFGEPQAKADGIQHREAVIPNNQGWSDEATRSLARTAMSASLPSECFRGWAIATTEAYLHACSGTPGSLTKPTVNITR
jgi:integrase